MCSRQYLGHTYTTNSLFSSQIPISSGHCVFSLLSLDALWGGGSGKRDTSLAGEHCVQVPLTHFRNSLLFGNQCAFYKLLFYIH